MELSLRLQADFEDEGFKESLMATAEDLLAMNVVPVFNENDAILSKRNPSPVRLQKAAAAQSLLCVNCEVLQQAR